MVSENHITFSDKYERSVMVLVKPKVYVTRQLFPEAIKIVEEVAEVEIFEGENNPIPKRSFTQKG